MDHSSRFHTVHAPELFRPASALLRFTQVLLCAVFLLSAIGHASHRHEAASGTVAHHLKCGYCCSFGGLMGPPAAAEVPQAAPAVSTLVRLPDESVPFLRPRIVQQPRGPPFFPNVSVVLST